jgi:hypothetical protein
MLPGIRFLFAAIVFAVSLVIFGMGAAALLRSAHEEFASLPNQRMAPPTVFAQQPVEPPPTLSMLRVETPAPAESAPVTVAVTPLDTASVAVPAPDLERTVAPDVVANLTLSPPPVAEAAPIEPARPDTPKIETAKIETPAVATVAVAPATPAVVPAGSIPEIVTITPAAVPPVDTIAEPETTATLTASDTQLSSSKIAVLGGPPVDTEPVPLPVAKPAIKPVRKVVKKPAVKKRRVVARPMATAAVAPQTDPFGLPLGQ